MKKTYLILIAIMAMAMAFVSASPVYGAQAPYGGTPWAIPGTIQCEDYDTGGEGVAYHDLTTANEGGQYRLTEGVDVGTCGEGGYAVGYTVAPNEWVEYTVNVASTGTYSVGVRAAAASDGAKIHIEIDGVNVTGSIAIPFTGGWETYTTLTVGGGGGGASLTAGQHIMKLVMETNGAYGYVANLNYITFALSVPDSLTINTGTVLNTITYPWLGVNYVGFWDSIQGSTASRNAMMNAGVEVLRFPGGAPADWYDWADPLAGGWSSTSTMNLWNYAQGVGSQCKLMLETNPTANVLGNGLVNDSSGTHAAAWVTYCKNNNIAAPYWEIGNEEDITLTTDYQWTAYQWYIDKFNEQAAAMKAADSSIKIIGNVGTNAWYWWGIHSLDMFMQRCGNKTGTGRVDAVSIHWYPAPAYPGWGNVISSAQAWQVNYDYIRSCIQANDTRNLPLFISETNAAASGGGDMAATMACAIANSDMLGAMAESGVQSVQLFGCIHAVDNNWGLLAGSGESQPAETPTCTYYTLPIWSKVGRTIVSVTGETDPATTLSAYGMKSANGHVQALIHNKTSAARSVQVAFSGFNPTGQTVSIYEIRPATAGDVWNYRCYYNNVNWPSPTTTSPLPGPQTATCSGATYTRTVPAYSVTMMDFGGTAGNNPPTVSITSPANGATFTAPASVTINATAADSDGTVSKVDFYQGATLLGTDTTSPYSYAWTNVAAGSYSLTAKATDNLGAVTTSTAVGITVNPANVPPTVSITSPANGATFTAPASVTINATAADSDGTVSKVDFYRGGTTLLGTDTTSPYSYAWTSVAAGSYSLTAKATDNLGAVTTSTAVGITVNAAGNVAPTVSITSPANGATYTAPASVTINATAADSDGTVSKVDFYRGGTTLLGTDTTSPYSYAWTSVAAGSYSLTAKATDNLGAVTTSAAVGITVNAAGGAGTGLKGEYYDNMDFTTLKVTRTDATVNFDWGSGSPDASIGVDTFSVRWTGQVQPLYSQTYTFYTNTDDGVRLWVNNQLLVDKWVDQGPTEWSGTIALTAGTKYVIKMDYYENGGGAVAKLSWSSSSQAKQIIPQSQLYPAAGNVAPTVSITSPANGATYTAPASVTINATAADSDGTVSKVDFYRGGTTLLGTDTTSPYSYAWTSVAAGSYSLTAKATDNLGAVTTSTAVGITVNAAGNVAPTVSITSPANGATYTAPASVTINATAADSDGTVSKVDFYQGATLLGTDTSSPYSYSWTSVAAGSYSLTAKATDNLGAVTTSAAVGITVNAAGGNVTPVVGTWYKLINRNSGKYMDVTGSSTADGAQLDQWTANSNTSQQWTLTATDSGYYTLSNRNSGKAAFVSDIGGEGAWVTQQPYGGSTAAQWTLTATDSGYYKITNRASGKAMQIDGGSTADGAIVVQRTYVSGLEQQWGFRIP